jgi:hypothetical protein
MVKIASTFWSVATSCWVVFIGKKPTPLYMHCSRIYTVPGAGNPTRDIGTLSSILGNTRPESEGDQPAQAWEIAVDDILREQE